MQIMIVLQGSCSLIHGTERGFCFPAARYVGAMGIDLALRWAWSIQLSSLVHLSSHEMTLLFEVLEIIR
jgi:hypothetical protein